MEEQIVCFLDLLGFSQCVEDNIQSAKSKLLNYNSAIYTLKLSEKNSQNISDNKYLKSSLATTFKYFIPASDSIFISSDINNVVYKEIEDINLFIMQLCSFLYNSYCFTSGKYENPNNSNEATEGEQIFINSKTKQPEIGTTTYSPCLFRGGLSIGECEEIKQLRIINYQLTEDCCNLAGKAVADAVHLEGIVDGPRIVICEDDYNRFDQNIKQCYFRKIEKKELKEDVQETDKIFYELLWPAIAFFKANGIDQDLKNLDSTLRGAYNLWKSKSNEKAKKHYKAFIDLIYNSILYFWNHDKKAKKHVTELKNIYII